MDEMTENSIKPIETLKELVPHVKSHQKILMWMIAFFDFIIFIVTLGLIGIAAFFYFTTGG